MTINKKLFFTLLLALGVRLLFLLKYGHFWDDELFSFVYSQKPLAQTLNFWVWETNPPLHMALLKLWFLVIPVSETAARVPSLIFGTTTVWALHNLTKRLFNEKIALFSALFLALAPYHIFISVTNRGYALLLLLTVVSANLFSKLFLEHSVSKRTYLWYVLTSIALLYTHLTAVSVLLSQFVVLIAMRPVEIKRFIKLNIIAGAAWLPWLVPSMLVKLNVSTVNTAWFLSLIQTPKQFIVSLQPLVTVINLWPLTLALILIFLGAIGHIIYTQSKNKSFDFNLVLFIILGLFPIIAAALMNVLQIKFFVIALPFVVTLIAYLLILYLKKPMLVAIVILALTMPGAVAVYQALPLQDWRTVNNYFATRYAFGENKILLYNNFSYKNSLNFYFKSLVPTLAYRLDTNDLDFDIITQNYLRTLHANTEVDAWIKDNNVTKYHEVFVLQDMGMGIALDKALERAGYTAAEEPYRPRLMGNHLIFHYVKNK